MDSLSVRLVSERHRTEWNWVEYRISLVNKSNIPILNPEIRYFAENSWIQFCERNKINSRCKESNGGLYLKDSLLTLSVDYVTWPFSVSPSIFSDGKWSTIKLKMKGMFYPGSNVDIYFRIYRNDWGAWDCSRDFSYQKNSNFVEENYQMAVYDASSQLLWGYDPTSGRYSIKDVLWQDRRENFLVQKFDGNSNEVIPAGRFWLLKDVPLLSKERILLKERGLKPLEAGRIQNKNLYLFRSEIPIKKFTLDSLLTNFYNAIVADDTTRLSIDFFRTEFSYEKKDSCESIGVCKDDSLSRTEFDLFISCWPDVTMGDCKNIAIGCGGLRAEIDRNLVVSTHTKETLSCLEINQNIRHIDVSRESKPVNDKGRKAINIDVLQNNEAWKNALLMQQPTTNWLSDADYTGEGIVVGVYDSGILYNHSTFNEVAATGELVQRKLAGESKIECKFNDCEHGSHVAGIIGGNGWKSGSAANGRDNFLYRGVAPKVNFYANRMFVLHQKGNVVNHSHINDFSGLYEFNSYTMDYNLFYDWKNCEDECDSISKASIYAAANNGGLTPQYGNLLSYHSILANTKNSTVVGNMSSVTSVRNSTSSMGPTWDGRIKPDLMAPGSGAEFRFDENAPLVLLIDYFRMYHKNAETPFFELNFGTNDSLLNPDLRRKNCIYLSESPEQLIKCNLFREKFVGKLEYLDDALASNGKALKWTENRLSAQESYVNWIYELFSATPFEVQQDDEIEIRFRRISGKIDYPIINGSVYFSSEDDFYDGYETTSVRWILGKIGDDYQTTRFPWNGKSLVSNFLRFGFNYDYGIVSSVPCKQFEDEMSCYGESSGTSMAAPFVSGIAALMYQKFRTKTGLSLDKFSMRNSTVKAILIHTSIDMEDSQQAHVAYNSDISAAEHDGNLYYTPYGKGPDFATGWGRVDAESALGYIEDYDETSKSFSRFREFDISNGQEKNWSIYVPEGVHSLRATLVWDDAPGMRDDGNVPVVSSLDSKLINDLDMYFISPSGKFYFPWRLRPLPTNKIDFNGNLIQETFGLENIHKSDIQEAERFCGKNDKLSGECFDHLNNVEVVDVDFPEKGKWQIVVRGTRIVQGNDSSGNAQVASIVSDLRLWNSTCQIVHPYLSQNRLVCEYALGDNLESFVTFNKQTYVGKGDSIFLYDDKNHLLGTYTGTGLSGKRIKVRGKKLKVILDSDNDDSQGYGFEISRIEKVPYSILPMLFETSKKRKMINE